MAAKGPRENEEIKKYVMTFVPNILDNYPLFTRTFGENFAKKRLQTNLKRVYTNGLNLEGIQGDFQKEEINLYDTIEREGLFSVQEVEQNSDYKFTLLHEAIHSILKKDMIECDKQNIKYRLRDF